MAFADAARAERRGRRVDVNYRARLWSPDDAREATGR